MDFVVFSLGRTATQWLARTLNCHSEIVCFHGPVPFLNVDPCDWDGYFAGVKNTWLTPHVDWNPFSGKTIDTIVHYGNVHGLDPSRWLAETDQRGRYGCVQMTREPFSRLASMKWRWRHVDYQNRPTEFEARYEQSSTSLVEAGLRYHSNDNLDEKMFVCACAQLFPHDAKFLPSEIPIMRMEDLKEFSSIERITTLLCGAIWKADEIDRAVRIGRVDAHDEKESLTGCQQEYAKRLIGHFGLQTIYEKLGYDVAS